MKNPAEFMSLTLSARERMAEIYARIRAADEGWGPQDDLIPDGFEGLSAFLLAVENHDGMPGGWSWRLKRLKWRIEP